MSKVELLIIEGENFQKAVREIIHEQKNSTLRLAYHTLCDCFNSNIKDIKNSNQGE